VNKIVLFITIAIVILLVVFYNKFTLFIIQPIGSIPEGRTLVVNRERDMPFIDSADAMCERRTNNVSLLCRGLALREISNMKIYARFPYIEKLYLISTDGKTYEK
jgi:hypothetical protein